MSANANIIRSIRLIAETDSDYYPIICTVKSVDLTTLTAYCIPLDTNYPDYSDASLMIDPQVGFLIVPSVNSQVLIQPMAGGGSYVAMYSSVDSIQLNGSDYGGLVKVADLVNKINALENLVNQMIQNAQVYTVTVPSGGGTVQFVALR